jgi:hypothetical protein
MQTWCIPAWRFAEDLSWRARGLMSSLRGPSLPAVPRRCEPIGLWQPVPLQVVLILLVDDLAVDRRSIELGHFGNTSRRAFRLA